MLDGLMPADPFRKKECRWRDSDCMVDHKKYDCMSTNIVYQIGCKQCALDPHNTQGSYIGQSGRSMHARQLEHGSGLRKDHASCPLTRHMRDIHPGSNLTPRDFQMKRLMSTRDNMTRLIGEGESIAEQEKEGSKLWNSKGEYGKSKLIRWTQTVTQI